MRYIYIDRYKYKIDINNQRGIWSTHSISNSFLLNLFDERSESVHKVTQKEILWREREQRRPESDEDGGGGYRSLSSVRRGKEEEEEKDASHSVYRSQKRKSSSV